MTAAAPLAVMFAAIAMVAPPPLISEIYEAGQESCATWLSTPSSEAEGAQWILGFVSSLNIAKYKNTDVFTKPSDGEAIVSEAKKECAANPNAALLYVTLTVERSTVPDMAP